MTSTGPAFQECTGSCHENVPAPKVVSSICDVNRCSSKYTFFLNSLQLILSLTLEMKSTSGNELASLLGLAASFSRRCIIGRLITYYTALDGQNWNYSFFLTTTSSLLKYRLVFFRTLFLINFACCFLVQMANRKSISLLKNNLFVLGYLACE